MTMMARPKGKPRSMKDIRQAVESYIRGDKMTDIAQRFGVTQPTVSYWVKRHGPSLGSKRYFAAKRKQGRRRETEPNDRDKDILKWAGVGLPAAKIGEIQGTSRQRISYIVKTWRDRNYVPKAVFRTGQVVRDCPDGDARYLVLEVHGKTGSVLQMVEFDKVNQCSRDIPNGRRIDHFKWFAAGHLCEVVDDKSVS